MSMSSTDKGLLTPDNCAVVFIDLQSQLLGGVLSIGGGELLDNVVLLAKAAKAFRVPVILTTVDFPGLGADLVPELVDLFPGQERIARTGMNAWNDPRFVSAVRRCGCRNFIVAGLWSETALAFAVLQMLEEGFGMYVVEDAAGGTSRRAHDAAIRRVEQAGAVSLTAFQFLLELQRDWSKAADGGAAIAIMKKHRPALLDHCSKDPGSSS